MTTKASQGHYCSGAGVLPEAVKGPDKKIKTVVTSSFLSRVLISNKSNRCGLL